MTDVLLTIAEVGSDAPRDHRPAVLDAAQAAYHALFDVGPDDPVPGVDRAFRHLVAARAARLEGDGAAAEFYLDDVALPGAASLVEDGADGEAGLRAPRRTRAALRHVDLLVQRPAAATADDLHGLIAAGWSPAEVVVLGQIVGLVSYQVRVAQGLRALDEIFPGEDR